MDGDRLVAFVGNEVLVVEPNWLGSSHRCGTATEGTDMTPTASTAANRAVVENTISIARPPEVVFDYVTDLEREPEWNNKLKAVQPLTDGPLRAGSRYQARFDTVGDSVIEYLRFDRPTLWATRSSGRRLDVRFVGEVTPEPFGCRVSLQTELLPHGVLRLVKPVLNRVMRTSWDRHLKVIKSTLEADPLTSTTAPDA